MKSISKVLLTLTSAIIFNSCDKVDPPYKQNTAVLSGDRKVLVEDYTGHKCGNCPRASRAIYELKQIYGENLIIMAIHAGGFAAPFPPAAPYYTYDFRTTEGTQLDTDFGISVAGNPNGMVNRRIVDGNIILGSTKWAEEVTNVLTSTDPVPVKITIDNSYINSSRELQTEVKTEFYSTLPSNYKLCVYMVEDSIVNWQKDYDTTPEDIPDYVHREVFRGSMNGTYGEIVTSTNIGNIDTKNYSFELDSTWSENHFSVIAFLFDDATKEIIQVEQEEVAP
jgi:hypothetical protein